MTSPGGVTNLPWLDPRLYQSRVSRAEAEAFCRALAERHYENFTVVSFLLPRPLRQHFANVYAYCRVSDDLADEIGDRERALSRLAEWGSHLDRCYEGESTHPVFVALAATIREFGNRGCTAHDGDRLHSLWNHPPGDVGIGRAAGNREDLELIDLQMRGDFV